MTLNNAILSDYISRINRVIDYILNHLGEELQVKDLAQVSCFSVFHFQRIFKMITGEPLNAYIRRRRLEKATMVLTTDLKRSVTDVALSYGFSSSANFSKAFTAFFGISPSKQRQLIIKNGSTITLSKDRKEISRDGKNSFDDFWNKDNILNRKALLTSLQFDIKEIAPLHVAYVRVFKGYKHDLIGKAWDKLMFWAYPRKLIMEDTQRIGIVYDDPDVSNEDQCQYDACITIPEQITEFQGKIGIQDIPGGLYVIHSFMASFENIDEISNGFINLYTWIILNDFSFEDNPPYMDTAGDPRKAKGKKIKVRIYVRIKPLT